MTFAGSVSSEGPPEPGGEVSPCAHMGVGGSMALIPWLLIFPRRKQYFKEMAGGRERSGEMWRERGRKPRRRVGGTVGPASLYSLALGEIASSPWISHLFYL